MTQDDALRQACEALCEKWFDTGARASWCPKMVDELLAFARAQRVAGYEAAANVVEGCQVPIGTDAARDYRNDEQHNLALWVLAQKIREASAKEYESRSSASLSA